MLKRLFLVLVLVLVSQTLSAQDEASELEELEQELNALESEEGLGNEGADFSEETQPNEDVVEETESLSPDEQLQEILEGSPEEDFVDILPEESEPIVEEVPAPTIESSPFSPENSVEEVPPAQQEEFFAPLEEPSLENPGSPSYESPSYEATDEQIVTPTGPDTASPLVDSAPPQYLQPLPDEPNLRKEQSIFNAYQYIKNYTNTDETWAAATTGRESETYTVQGGDNLWDLSLTLFGNPYFWAKIWQLNDRITNPHEIKPGDSLVFVEGDLNQAPQLSQGEESVAPVEEEVFEEEAILADLPELPAQSDVMPPLIDVPPSLAPWHTSVKTEDDFATGRVSLSTNNLKNMFRLSSYFVEKVPPALGGVVEIEMGSDSASLYQYVFVEGDNINIGDNLLSYQVMPPVRKHGQVVGYPIQLQGVLKVTETASTSKNLYKAIVTYVANPVSKGSFVQKGSFPIKIIDYNAPQVAVTAEIVGAEFDNRRKVLGTGSVVYFLGGSDIGMQEGLIVQILKNQKARNEKTMVENNTNVIAKVQIVDVQDNRSTGLIISSKDRVAVGDYSGAPTILSLDSSETKPLTNDEDEFLEDIESEIQDEADFFE